MALRISGMLVALAASSLATGASGLRYGGDISEAIDASGAFECPCLSAFLPSMSNVKTMLEARGFPAGYGLSSCNEWDMGLTDPKAQQLSECYANGQLSTTSLACSSLWCYVDPEVCQLNAVECKAVGGTIGSITSTACRERETIQSNMLDLQNITNLYFSYQTCGRLGRGKGPSEGAIQDEIAGSEIRAVIAQGASVPWTFPGGYVKADDFDKSASNFKGFSGALVKTVSNIAKQHNPPLNITLLDGWASQQSQDYFPSSSYTACVMDVVVGKVDICIADFWVTPERLSFDAEFMIAFGSDDFYVLAPKKLATITTIRAILQKPWAPFSNSLWVAFFGFLFFTALITLFADSILDVGDKLEAHKDWKADDFENQTLVGRFAKCVYLSFMAYVSGGPLNSPSSVPARLAAVGFGWFLLVTMASYTANLASIFTIQTASNEINSIEDAINMDLTICSYSVVSAALSSKYPNAKINGSFSDWPPMLGAMHRGTCDVAIFSEKSITAVFAGQYNTADCVKMDNGMTKAEAEMQNVECVRLPSGLPDSSRDCSKFIQVGSKVMTVPISMPISKHFVHSFSYSFRSFAASGEFPTMVDNEIYRARTKTMAACPADDGAEDSTLHVQDMLGTFLIAILIQLVSLVLCAIEYSTGKTIQQLLNLYDDTPKDVAGLKDGEEPVSKHEIKHEIQNLKDYHHAEMMEIKKMLRGQSFASQLSNLTPPVSNGNSFASQPSTHRQLMIPPPNGSIASSSGASFASQPYLINSNKSTHAVATSPALQWGSG